MPDASGDCEYIYVDQGYGIDGFQAEDRQPFSDETPTIRDIAFRNISIDTVRGWAIYLCGLPENHLRSIALENITAHAPLGMYKEHADDVKAIRVNIDNENRF